MPSRKIMIDLILKSDQKDIDEGLMDPKDRIPRKWYLEMDYDDLKALYEIVRSTLLLLKNIDLKMKKRSVIYL